jgi:hypothetical protein
MAGLLALYVSLASEEVDATAATFEQIVATPSLLWGAVISYRGGRNVLVRLTTADVQVRIVPEEVTVGGSFAARVSIEPHNDVRLDAITGVLRCTQHYVIRSGTSSRRTESQVVHTDRRSIAPDQRLAAGTSSLHELSFTIPVGMERSDHSSTTGTYWTLDLTVAFAGRPDWGGSYAVTVV